MSLLLINYIVNNYNAFKELKQFNIYYLLIIFILYTLSMFFASIKDVLIVRKLSNKRLKLFNYFQIFVKARLLTKFVPQSGNVYNAIELKKSYSIDYNYTIITLIINLISNNVFNIAILLLIIQMFYPDYIIGEFILRDIILIIFMIMLFIIFISYYILKKVKLYTKIDYKKYYNNIILLFRDNKLIAKLFSTNFVALVFATLAKYFILMAVGIKISFILLIILGIIDGLLIFANFTPGNIGIIEFTYAYVFEISGFSYSEGIVLALYFRIIAISSLCIYYFIIQMKTFIQRPTLTVIQNI